MFHMLVTCTLFASMHAHFPKGDLWASLMHQILVDLNQQLDIEIHAVSKWYHSLLENVSTIEILQDLTKGQLKVLQELTKDSNVEPLKKYLNKSQ